jgi:hypothetical protein
MFPTLKKGDWIVATRISHSEMTPEKWQRVVNQVVIAEADGLLQIKRVSQCEVTENGSIQLWLLGDNPAASTDSRSYGWVSAEKVMARYLLRYKRGRHRAIKS